MTRFITQILVGLMLLFGALTLFPKAYVDYRAKKTGKGILYSALGLLSLFFALMAFNYAYLILRLEILK